MSHILAEDWTDMRKLFPYFRDTSDKEGRPGKSSIPIKDPKTRKYAFQHQNLKH